MYKPTLFALPSLPDAVGAKATFDVDADAIDPGIFGLDPAILLLFVEPTLRGLLLAGYEVRKVDFAVGSSAKWLQFDMRAWTAVMHEPTSGSDLDRWQTGATASVIFEVVPRRHHVYGMAMHVVLPSSGPKWVNEIDATSGEGLIEIWSTDAITLAGHVLSALVPMDRGFVEELVDALVPQWGPAGGLLGLFNPANWYEGWSTPPSTFPDWNIYGLPKLVHSSIGTSGPDVETFLLGQILGTRQPETVTLRELVPEDLGLGNKLGLAGHREFWELLGARATKALPTTVLDDLPKLPWIDALLILVNSGVLDPLALADGYVIAEDVYPVEVERTDDDTVSITVFGHGPITLERVWEDPAYSDLESYFCWEFINPEPDDDGVPGQSYSLLIVAAPGVEITGSLPESIELVIYRVQDHALVPPWGSTINTAVLTGTYTILDDPDHPALQGGWNVVPELRVSPRPDGVELCFTAAVNEENESSWYTSLSNLFADEDKYLKVQIQVKDVRAGDTRFAFEVERHEDPATGGFWHTLVVVASPGVKVAQQHTIATKISPYYQRTHASGGSPPIAGVPRPGEVSVDDILSMPATTMTGGSDPDYSGTFVWTKTAYMMAFTLDMAVGSIPIFGDAVDAIELVGALATGKDRWGRPVTNFDLMLMAGGTMLPYVSSSILRGAKAAVRPAIAISEVVDSQAHLTARMGVPADTATATAAKAFDKSQADSMIDDMSTLRSLDDGAGGLIALGTKLDDLAEGATKAAAAYQLEIVDLIDDAGTGFLIPALQQAYRKYLKRGGLLGPEAWAKAQTVGEPFARLKSLLGDDYVTRSSIRSKGLRPVQKSPMWGSISHIVRPALSAYDPAAIVALLKSASDLAAALEDLGRSGAQAAADAARIQAIVAKFSGGSLAALDETNVLKLLGTKTHSSEGVVEALMIGLDNVSLEASKAGRTLDELLACDGIETYFEALVTRSGFEHGSGYELFRLARNLDDVGGDTTRVTLQVVMDDGLAGPDLAILNAAKTLATIEQVKSYRSLSALIRASAEGEVFRQVSSDLFRLAEQAFKVPVPGGGKVPVAREMRWSIDWTRVAGGEFASIDKLITQRNAVVALEEQINAFLASPGFRKALEGSGVDLSSTPFSVVIDLD